jgi:hypothetical protein
MRVALAETRLSRKVTAAMLLLVMAVSGLVVEAAGAAPQTSHALAVRPPHFGRLPPGWGQFSEPTEPLTRQGANAGAVATSWHYRPNPIGWGNSIPRDGIAVQVLLIRRQVGRPTNINLCHVTPHLAAYPLVQGLPLRLPRTTTATFEGSPKIPEYRVFGRVGESYNFEVRVDINTPHPPAAMLNTAQHAVTAINFPRWPNPLRC